MDYPSAKFGYFSFCRFGFIVRTDRQTDRQTESHTQTRLIAILTRLPSASVTKNRFLMISVTIFGRMFVVSHRVSGRGATC